MSLPVSTGPGESIRADGVPERSAAMAWQVIEGGTILLNIAGKELMGLNEVGGYVWHLIDGTRSIAQIAQAVAAEFDFACEVVEADVRAFVAELTGLGALDWKT